ncbi:hypothetical protein L5515_006940 [Caenorhabditis briggsae]|uniref:Uncharacterized protein n=1 Tax=Caenorhabditis briggsae TaxID=6238 RepID=A0AAE9EX47_CAEBR|nr:hypothetical protein L5515_006940 [Caenorhabditis briggsae]
MKLFLLFAFLFSVAHGQKLINLNTLKGGNEVNQLNSYAPCGIYVSAASDNTATLQNIFVVQKDGTKTSLYDIKSKTSNGKMTPLVVIDTATLTTSLNTNVLKGLNGVIYLSLTAQYNNKNFNVYDVSSTFNFNLKPVTVETLTLFLNTYRGTNPLQSSIISQWNQDPSSSSYIYAGIPQDQTESKNTQIFSNPVVSDKFTQYFSNVEKFTLASTVAFYLRTSNGGPSFRVEPGSWNIGESTTSAYSTTGFFMRPQGKMDGTVTTVHIKRDTSYSGTSGANMLGSLENRGKVSVSYNDGASAYDDNAVPNPFFSPWSIPVIGENLKISATSGESGYYYVQYFVLQGGKKGSPTSGPGQIETTTKASGAPTVPNPGAPTVPNPGAPTVPGRVETTTKSSDSIKILFPILIFISFTWSV